MSHKNGVQNNEDANKHESTTFNFAQWRPLNKNPENLEPLFPESEATVGFLWSLITPPRTA